MKRNKLYALKFICARKVQDGKLRNNNNENEEPNGEEGNIGSFQDDLADEFVNDEEPNGEEEIIGCQDDLVDHEADEFMNDEEPNGEEEIIGSFQDDFVENMDNDEFMDYEESNDAELVDSEDEKNELIPEFDDVDNADDTLCTLQEQITKIIENTGYSEHLREDLGGKIKERAIKTATGRIAQFLIQTYAHKKSKMLEANVKRVTAWSVCVFTKEFRLLTPYVKFLGGTKGLKPSTILTYLDALDTYSKWLVYISPCSTILSNKKQNLDGFKYIVGRYRTSQRKAKKEANSGENSITVQGRVNSLRLPPDGFKGLQQIVAGRFEMASGLITERDVLGIDKTVYNEFLGLLIAALYVFVPQGRIGGVQSLQFEDYETMMKMGYAMSSAFKTSAKFGYQPVLSNKQINGLITTYFQKLRPLAVKNARKRNSIGTTIKDPTWFWLTFSGKHCERLGRRLTQFFLKNGHFHVTTTDIRSLLETKAHEAMQSGGISPQQRDAISAVGGHSSQTVTDYYIKHNRSADRRNAYEAFGIMVPTQNSQSDEQEQDEGFPDQDECKEPDVGIEHPEYKTERSKAKWTEKEIEYTGKWLIGVAQKNPNKQQPCFKELHAHIMQDPEARKLFHRYHACSPQRLQWGKKAYEKRHGKINQLIRGDPDYTPGMIVT